ncbi:uncharacterized protein BDFB_009817 [Asbolus verrucosus]|uniref:Uncharacterized protein n=1 Tax=Asbolus verrucosus TaxID=1661398 RepID=A0A482W333_ASBVE|nr:uncharacterized protein BDFB_009817 [Asbolus verrucosus]
MIKLEPFLSLILVLHILACAGLNREKRTLIWRPGGSRLQIIAGFGIPVDLKRETVIVGTVFKANYKLPTNVSDIKNPYVFYQRKKRAATRWDIYGMLSQAIEMRGFEGKSCILRAICEVARTPLEKNYGLFHELIHTFFTEKVSYHPDNEYYAAQILGEKNEKCEKIFRDCSSSLMDMFTFHGNELDFQ